MRVLHAGCGGDPLPDYMHATEEVRLDADPEMQPDIVGNMCDLGDLGEFDAIYCCHALEHLFPEDVGIALKEFRRVLKPGGTAWIQVPNLEGITVSDEVLYKVGDLEITALDMIYGHRNFFKVTPWMAHRTGFTPKLLEQAFAYAGFERVIMRDTGTYNLLAVAIKGAA
jgi:SAM-dependent methyltransferase